MIARHCWQAMAKLNRDWFHRSYAGFTFIQVLATTAIIAILLAVAVPNSLASLRQARVGKAIAEIGIIRDGVELYRQQHGGILPATLADLIPDNPAGIPLDPWGNPYVFANAHVIPAVNRRVDGLSIPINQEYDIYSIGENGISFPDIRHGAAQDDIIMASDGSYFGLAAEY